MTLTKTSVKIEGDIYRRVKIFTANEGVTIRSIIELALNEYLINHEVKKNGHERIAASQQTPNTQ